MKKKRIIAFSAALVFSILFSLIFKGLQTGKAFSAETILYGLIVFINILILGSVAFATLSRFSKKSASETNKHLVPSFLVFVALAFIISLTLVSIGVYAFYLINGLDTTNFVSNLFTVELSSAVKQLTIWILFGSIFFFYIIWRKSIEREQKLREENLRYKYQNLKSQVNPHFLFNSLNVLSELVHEDAKKSDNYIQNLSSIYRYILENEETDLIDLEKEIDFVKQYFYLQQERDGGKIALHIDIKDVKGYKIVPVSLQVLLENALKHNARSTEKPLTISISIQEGNIVVSNPIQKKSILEDSTRTGLSNLHKRTKIITGKEPEISESKNDFIVKLPILKQ